MERGGGVSGGGFAGDFRKWVSSFRELSVAFLLLQSPCWSDFGREEPAETSGAEESRVGLSSGVAPILGAKAATEASASRRKPPATATTILWGTHPRGDPFSGIAELWQEALPWKR